MRRNGFTLIELIVAMTAGAAFALMVFVMFNPLRNWFFTQQRRGSVSEASLAMGRVVKEIRRVKNPQNISIFTATQFRFTDIDNNTIDFQLSGGNLLLNSDVLARNVGSLQFDYLKKDGTAATQANRIRVVRAAIGITAGGNTFNLRSADRVRNL